MIKLTINGNQIQARKGETVLDVCQREDIYIPTLCYQKELEPYGGCRLCLVEVKGWSRPVTACTLPVKDGMVIETNTAFLNKLRRFTLQLILSEHPHGCLICDKQKDCAQYQGCIQKSAIVFGCKFCAQNNNCELQRLVEYLGVKEIPFTFHYRNLGVERFDPFFDRDYNICILCGRCVRVCQDVRGAGILDFHHRGPLTLVGTAFNQTHIEANCQFCGACVDACPTGALKQRYSKWTGPVEKVIETTCALCSIGCAINLNVGNNQILSSIPGRDKICVRGRFGIAPLVHHPKRITSPMLKKDGRFVTISWEEALNFASAKFTEHKGKVGIVFSPQLSGETIDAVYVLARSLAGNNITTSLNLGETFRPINFKKLARGSIFIIINTDMVSDFSPVLLKLKRQLKNEIKFIVIDAIKSKSTALADFWLKPNPAKETDVLKILLAQKKMRNNTGVSDQEIEAAQNQLSGKKIYLLYNRTNVGTLRVPKSVQLIPLSSHINALKISNIGVGCSLEDLLNNKNIDCLYLIGLAPKLNRGYKTIIVQDYFMPTFDFDLFLPAATFVETDGTLINIEGKTKPLQRAIGPLGNSKPDDWIINEIRKTVKIDTKTAKPRYKMKTIRGILKEVTTSKEYPLNLIVRENCYMYRGFPLSQFMKGFERLRQDACVWLNPELAKKMKIDNSGKIMIVGKNFNIKMRALISDVVPEQSLLVFYQPAMGVVTSQPVRIERIKK